MENGTGISDRSREASAVIPQCNPPRGSGKRSRSLRAASNNSPVDFSSMSDINSSLPVPCIANGDADMHASTSEQPLGSPVTAGDSETQQTKIAKSKKPREKVAKGRLTKTNRCSSKHQPTGNADTADAKSEATARTCAALKAKSSSPLPKTFLPCADASTDASEAALDRHRSIGVLTEPECLGPCEPGTHVNLDGIVWQETANGVLVVNVTWRGKTYVGTLLDATRHDWAPPRLQCESPHSDVDARVPKGRGKRRPTLSSAFQDINERKLRKQCRGGSHGTQQQQQPPPPSPAKSENSPTVSGGKRKSGRAAASASNANGGNLVFDDSDSPAKRRRSSSRCGTTSSASSKRPLPSTSPYIECPEPNCSKKYKHVNGLRYHQTHAHLESASTISDVDTASSALDQSMLPLDGSGSVSSVSDGEAASGRAESSHSERDTKVKITHPAGEQSEPTDLSTRKDNVQLASGGSLMDSNFGNENDLHPPKKCLSFPDEEGCAAALSSSSSVISVATSVITVAPPSAAAVRATAIGTMQMPPTLAPAVPVAAVQPQLMRPLPALVAIVDLPKDRCPSSSLDKAKPKALVASPGGIGMPDGAVGRAAPPRLLPRGVIGANTALTGTLPLVPSLSCTIATAPPVLALKPIQPKPATAVCETAQQPSGVEAFCQVTLPVGDDWHDRKKRENNMDKGCERSKDVRAGVITASLNPILDSGRRSCGSEDVLARTLCKLTAMDEQLESNYKEPSAAAEAASGLQSRGRKDGVAAKSNPHSDIPVSNGASLQEATSSLLGARAGGQDDVLKASNNEASGEKEKLLQHRHSSHSYGSQFPYPVAAISPRKVDKEYVPARAVSLGASLEDKVADIHVSHLVAKKMSSAKGQNVTASEKRAATPVERAHHPLDGYWLQQQQYNQSYYSPWQANHPFAYPDASAFFQMMDWQNRERERSPQRALNYIHASSNGMTGNDSSQTQQTLTREDMQQPKTAELSSTRRGRVFDMHSDNFQVLKESIEMKSQMALLSSSTALRELEQQQQTLSQHRLPPTGISAVHSVSSSVAHSSGNMSYSGGSNHGGQPVGLASVSSSGSRKTPSSMMGDAIRSKSASSSEGVGSGRHSKHSPHSGPPLPFMVPVPYHPSGSIGGLSASLVEGLNAKAAFPAGFSYLCSPFLRDSNNAETANAAAARGRQHKIHELEETVLLAPMAARTLSALSNDSTSSGVAASDESPSHHFGQKASDGTSATGVACQSATSTPIFVNALCGGQFTTASMQSVVAPTLQPKP